MNILSPYTPQATDYSPYTEQILERIYEQLLLNGSGNVNNADNNCISIANDIVEFGTSTTLPSIPANAKTAIVAIEADVTTTDKTIVAHYSETLTVTTTVGMPIGHGGVIELLTKQNIDNFIITGLEDEKIHHLQVTYYS